MNFPWKNNNKNKIRMNHKQTVKHMQTSLESGGDRDREKKWQILIEGKQLENALGKSRTRLHLFSLLFFLYFFGFGLSYIKIWFLLVLAAGITSIFSVVGVKNILVVCGNQKEFFFKIFDLFSVLPFFSPVHAATVWLCLLLSVSVPLLGDANFWLPVNGDSCSGLAIIYRPTASVFF